MGKISIGVVSVPAGIITKYYLELLSSWTLSLIWYSRKLGNTSPKTTTAPAAPLVRLVSSNF
jgi:hypothetical protein